MGHNMLLFSDISESQWMFNPNSLEIFKNDSAQWIVFHLPFENCNWPLPLRHTPSFPLLIYSTFTFACDIIIPLPHFKFFSPRQLLTSSLNCIWLRNYCFYICLFLNVFFIPFNRFSFFEKHCFSYFDYYFLT